MILTYGVLIIGSYNLLLIPQLMFYAPKAPIINKYVFAQMRSLAFWIGFSGQCQPGFCYGGRGHRKSHRATHFWRSSWFSLMKSPKALQSLFLRSRKVPLPSPPSSHISNETMNTINGGENLCAVGQSKFIEVCKEVMMRYPFYTKSGHVYTSTVKSTLH